jgi:O-antigen/teichoic acid export membrane protein
MTVLGGRSVDPAADVPERAPQRLLGGLSPSLRDGLALVLSNGLSSAVGLGYWVLAARLFSPAAVGVNNVALSTMMLLGGVAQLNMTYALLRFVPVSGAAARRLVIGGYVVGAGAAALVGGLFALGADLWSEELVDAAGPWWLVLFFVVATPLWSIFVIQDFVLTGIRRAAIVPGENLVFALLKIVLLVLAALLAVPAGIAVSWVVSTALIVVGINGWLLLRGLPQFSRESTARAMPITIGGIARFVRADYAGAVFWQCALFGLPALVLARLGAEDAAVYGIVWTIAQALYTVSSSMGQSMVAHSSAADPTGIEAARRAMVRRAMTLVAPVVAVLLVASPLVLSLFGTHYAQEGSLPLVLLALSAVPNVVTASTVNAARVRQRMGVLFGVPATLSVIVIVASWLLMPRLGIVGVGIAWLTAQTLVAAGILIATAPWLPPLLATRIEAVRSAALLRRVRPLADTHADAGWVLGQRLTGGSDSVVVGFGPSGADAVCGALLKASDSPLGQVQLRKQTEVLRALHADERLQDWHALLPTIVGEGDVGGSYYVLESRLPGSGGLAALTDPARRRTYRSSAIATISEMHRATAQLSRIGDDELRRWVHEPMATVASALPRVHRAAALALEAALADRLRGALVATAWAHGDYTADNLLSDDAGRIIAVVDWCDGDPAGLAVLDVVSFLLTTDVATGDAELGAVVLDRLADARKPDGDLLVRVQRNLGGDVLGTDVLTLLAWLQHVSHNLAKSPSYAANPVWVRRNLVPVVRDAQLT